MSSYRNLNLGAKLVNGVPRSFSKSSFFQPIIDIYNYVQIQGKSSKNNILSSKHLF